MYGKLTLFTIAAVVLICTDAYFTNLNTDLSNLAISSWEPEPSEPNEGTDAKGLDQLEDLKAPEDETKKATKSDTKSPKAGPIEPKDDLSALLEVTSTSKDASKIAKVSKPSKDASKPSKIEVEKDKSKEIDVDEDEFVGDVLDADKQTKDPIKRKQARYHPRDSVVVKASHSGIYPDCKGPKGYDCTVSLRSMDDTPTCMKKRTVSIMANRQYYKLTRSGEKQTIKFPLKIPFLNQTMPNVKGFTAFDEVDAQWLLLLKSFGDQVNKTLLQSMENLKKLGQRAPDFKHLQHYVGTFMKHNEGLSMFKPPASMVFTNPAIHPDFTDLTQMDILSDDIFVQKRFSGPCPFLVKLITVDGKVGHKWEKIKSNLNPDGKFDAALQQAIGCNSAITMAQASADEILYALYFPEFNDMEAKPDFFNNPAGILDITSPIALFVRTQSGDLKVFAIQEDYKNSSAVYTPNSDVTEWQLAKARVNMADHSICQSMWHLSHVHFSANIYCDLFRSHFDTWHPIQQIMRYHCQGTVPHIALTWFTLGAPGNHGQMLFSMHHDGFVDLSKKGVKEFAYDTLDLKHVLQSHGLDKKDDEDKFKLKYYPFRDDGLVLYKEFESFAKEFVDKYYENDGFVAADAELQGFAQQVSIDGGEGDSYGGKGNIKGFPTVFKTKEDVQLFVTRFIWQIAMHASINYPLEPWGTLVPLSPGKMYKKKSSENVFAALADAPTTIGTIAFGTSLGNYRLNRMFDYHEKINDDELKMLVKKYYDRLNECVQPLLAKRNAARKAAGKMGFQYLEPRWLTNSVHI